MNKETYKQTNVAVSVLCAIYALAYVLHGTVAGLEAVSRLRPGLWFSWQMAALIAIALAGKYEMRECSDKTAATYHSTTVFAARRAAHISMVTIWVRSLLALLLFGIDLAYLLIHAVHCFSLDCTTDPTAQCCAEGTLYGVALVGVLIQAITALIMLWFCVRMPFLPSFYVWDPLDTAYETSVTPARASNGQIGVSVDSDPVFGTSFRALGHISQS